MDWFIIRGPMVHRGRFVTTENVHFADMRYAYLYWLPLSLNIRLNICAYAEPGNNLYIFQRSRIFQFCRKMITYIIKNKPI